MFLTYSKIPNIWFLQIVTYLSTQYSIAIHTKVKEYQLNLGILSIYIYLQQLQFLSHVSLYFVLGIVVSGKLTEYYWNFVGSFI